MWLESKTALSKSEGLRETENLIDCLAVSDKEGEGLKGDWVSFHFLRNPRFLRISPLFIRSLKWKT